MPEINCVHMRRKKIHIWKIGFKQSQYSLTTRYSTLLYTWKISLYFTIAAIVHMYTCSYFERWPLLHCTFAPNLASSGLGQWFGHITIDPWTLAITLKYHTYEKVSLYFTIAAIAQIYTCSYFERWPLLYCTVTPIQPIAEAHVSYSIFKWLFCLFRLCDQGPGRRHMPCRHEKEKHSMQRAYQNGLLLSEIDLISLNMCLKWRSMYIIIYRNCSMTSIALIQRFVCAYTNSCIPVSRACLERASVCAYTNKSLNGGITLNCTTTDQKCHTIFNTRTETAWIVSQSLVYIDDMWTSNTSMTAWGLWTVCVCAKGLSCVRWNNKMPRGLVLCLTVWKTMTI